MTVHDRRQCVAPGCEPCRHIRLATLRFLGNPRARLTGPTREQSDPVLWADAQASYHDLRVALCVARGVPLDRIDPVTGHHRAAVRGLSRDGEGE